jgi:Fe2+ transport system protein FeoA
MVLSDIKCGESCRVKKIDNDLASINRLNDLGLTCGVVVTLVKKAPFGDPLLIRLRNFMLAIRLFDAQKITVEML